MFLEDLLSFLNFARRFILIDPNERLFPLIRTISWIFSSKAYIAKCPFSRTLILWAHHWIFSWTLKLLVHHWMNLLIIVLSIKILIFTFVGPVFFILKLLISSWSLPYSIIWPIWMFIFFKTFFSFCLLLCLTLIIISTCIETFSPCLLRYIFVFFWFHT